MSSFLLSKDRLFFGLFCLLKWLEADNWLVMCSMLPYGTGILPVLCCMFFVIVAM